MQLSEIIKKVNSDKRLIPDLMKCEKGNNFRAVSESAILDVINPVLEEGGWFYTVNVKKSDLQIKEAYGSKGRKLQFIATVEVALDFFYDDPEGSHYYGDKYHTEAVGMGIDDNDKAMGKAYTYAVKYALLKLFRLRYGDDSDYESSKPLLVDKPKEEQEKKPGKAPHKSKSPSSEPAMTENQRDYILGLMKKKGASAESLMNRFDGYNPEEDESIPMKTARKMIEYLNGMPDDDLPF